MGWGMGIYQTVHLNREYIFLEKRFNKSGMFWKTDHISGTKKRSVSSVKKKEYKQHFDPNAIKLEIKNEKENPFIWKLMKTLHIWVKGMNI